MNNPFNQFPQKYDQWYERYHWVYQSEIFALERLLPRRVNAIEIGVGSGRFASSFGIRYGIDPSENLLKLAMQRNINPIQAKAEDLPLCSESFNLVLMVSTICFLDDINQSLKEVCRILKPFGELVIGFIDKFSPLGAVYEQNRGESVFYRQANFYSSEELERLLLEAGFDDIFFVQTLFKPLRQINEIEVTKNGYGKGSFVVVRGVKY